MSRLLPSDRVGRMAALVRPEGQEELRRALLTTQGIEFLVPLQEVLLLDPSAIGRAFFPNFFGNGESASFERKGPLAIVSIEGPLMQKSGWFWDGYDDIRARFEKALADSSVKGIVLKIDSPGGMCAGCFEATEAMRAAKLRYKTPVYAYADEMAASAAYALAAVADEIWLPKSGLVGSVGTIITLAEQSEALAKDGIRVAVITTGKLKADGHPAVPLTDEVIERFRARANFLNGIFVGQVSESRGMSAADILRLEAGVFHGDDAVRAKLADGVSSYDAFLAKVQSQIKVSPPRAAVAARNAAEGRSMTDNENPNLNPPLGLSLIAATLGMASTASERDVQARTRELADAERDLLQATGKASVAEALGAVKGWKVSHDALVDVQTELAKLRKEGASRDLDGIIESAKAAGKITSEKLETTCREIGASSPAQLRALIETLPVVGGGTLRREATREPEAAAALTAEDDAVARQLGITAEEMVTTRREMNARKAG